MGAIKVGEFITLDSSIGVPTFDNGAVHLTYTP